MDSKPYSWNKTGGNYTMTLPKTDYRKKTSIKILPKVWEETKIEAIKDHVDLSIYTEQALNFYNKNRVGVQGQ